jgi:zinc transport system substrate-binding protein
MKKILIQLACLLYSLSFSAESTANKLRVVVTINPIYSLVKNVIGDLHDVHLLIKKNQSPHNYQIRPSDVSRLDNADLIITIGDGFEVFLLNYLNKSDLRGKVIKLVEAEGLELLPIKQKFLLNLTEGLTHDEHPHGHGPAHIHADDLDWHFWSDPENATAIVRCIAKEFSEHDPANASLYSKNAERTIARLTALDATLKSKLSGLQDRNFLVMHDGYQYLERRYKLSNVGVIITDKNLSCSFKHMKKMREITKEKKVLCVFTEPQTSVYLTERIAKFLEIKVGCIDIEWGEFNEDVPPKDLYFFMLEKDSANIVQCLKP